MEVKKALAVDFVCFLKIFKRVLENNVIEREWRRVRKVIGEKEK